MNIFISYRRSDSRHIAGRIAERLNDAPGVRRVFIDVDGINPGMNFADKIDEALHDSHVCLVIMGDDWVGAREQGKEPRIIEVGDFVRLETAAAIARGKKVIPVLVDGASMPAADTLPADVRPIVTIDAVFVRHNSFSQDLELLEDGVFSRRSRTPITRFFRRRPLLKLFLRVVAGVIAAGVLLIGLGEIHSAVTGKHLAHTLGGEGRVWLVIIFVLALGAAVPVWLSLRR